MPVRRTTRRIQFFTFSIKDTTENETQLTFEEIKNIFANISHLPQGREVQPTIQNGFEQYNDTYVCMRKIQVTNNYIFGWLGYTRNSDLPLEMDGITIEPVEIEDGVYLYDPTSFMIRDNGVLLLEFNIRGPKHVRLSTFIKSVCDAHSEWVRPIWQPNIERIVKGNRRELLEELSSLRTISMKVRFTNLLPLNVHENWLSHLLHSARGYTEEKGITSMKIELSVGRHSDREISADIDDILEAFEAYQGSAGAWIIKGKDNEGSTKEVNLWHFYLSPIHSVMLMGNSHAADPADMLMAMRNAYTQNSATVQQVLDGRIG